MGCVTPPSLMTSCLLAEAVPKMVTSFTVLQSWVAAIPTPPAIKQEKQHTKFGYGQASTQSKISWREVRQNCTRMNRFHLQTQTYIPDKKRSAKEKKYSETSGANVHIHHPYHMGTVEAQWLQLWTTDFKGLRSLNPGTPSWSLLDCHLRSTVRWFGWKYLPNKWMEAHNSVMPQSMVSTTSWSWSSSISQS